MIGLKTGIPLPLSLSRAQRALSVLRKYGTDAHLWMPGVGYVNGVTASNWIDSAGTVAGAVDQPVGLVRPAGYSTANLLSFSEAFDNAAWTKTRTTVTANAIAAPNGTTTADKIVEDSSASTTHFLTSSYVSAGALPTGSVYLKAAERTFAGLAITRDNGAAFSSSSSLVVNLTDGTFTGGSGSSPTVTNEGNGWWRVSITATTVATTNYALRVYVSSGSTSANETYTGDGTSGIYVWGAELEVGSSATAYTPSMGITATQATTANKPILRQTSGGYSWQFDGTDDRLALSSVPFQMADNHCVVASYSATSLASNADLFSIRSNVAANPAALLRLSTGGVVQAFHQDDAGTVQTVSTTGSVGTNTAFVASMRRSSGVVVARRNGGNQASGSQAFGATSFTSAAIGVSPIASPSGFSAGFIGPVISIKGTVSDADLLTLEKFVGACSGVTI